MLLPILAAACPRYVPCLGFTGTRAGMTDAQKEQFELVLRYLRPLTLHHGDCIGADADCHAACRALGDTRVVAHPCNLERLRAFCQADIVHQPLPPLKRNRIIVAHCHLLVATPDSRVEQLRSGTWSTIRFAADSSKPVAIIYPDGWIDLTYSRRRQ